MEEYYKVKKNLTEGKPSGSDKTQPEVLKICRLKDIILENIS